MNSLIMWYKLYKLSKEVFTKANIEHHARLVMHELDLIGFEEFDSECLQFMRTELMRMFALGYKRGLEEGRQ